MRPTQFDLEDDERREGMVCLVLLLGGLDELLLAIAALRALRRTLPRHRLVLAGHPAVTAAALHWQLAGAALPARPWHLPRTTPPDVAVNLTDAGPHGHRVLLELRPRRLVAAACADLRTTGPHWDLWHADGPLVEHRASRWCRIVSAGLDVQVDTRDALLPRPVTVARPRGSSRPVLVHPGGPRERRWPADRFAALAASLAAAGDDVRVVAAGDERLAEAVAATAVRSSGVSAGSVEVWRPAGIPELAAGVAGARAVVSGDTAVGHLAGALAVPGVHLHGPTPARERGPLTLARRARVVSADGGVAPAAMDAIGLDEVAGALADVLAPAPADTIADSHDDPRAHSRADALAGRVPGHRDSGVTGARDLRPV